MATCSADFGRRFRRGAAVIFVTVGTQLPFPRLITCLDEIARRMPLSIFAQTADPAAQPMHLQSKAFLDPDEYEEKVAECTVMVGHAGIGTVLQAKRAQKPLIVFPRHAEFGEHRNDHQLATAKFLNGVEGVYVAWDASELEALLANEPRQPASPAPGPEADRLIQALAAQLRLWGQSAA